MSLKALLALALALQFPSQALACRVGWDQHLFEQAPPADVLAGAEVIRVRFSNASPATDKWPTYAADPYGEQLGYTLIGIARRLDGADSAAEPFPVFAFVTSCSRFWAMSEQKVRTTVEGDYYLVGRFDPKPGVRAFYAGGRRMDGRAGIYGGWHF